MVRTGTTKGERTRQRIVELAAPVFNRQGYVGASMRDLTNATGLEKGGIYNHFGSKEQLALEAYDYAMSRVTNGIARSQDGATDAIDRLRRMIRAFAEFARKPAIAGGYQLEPKGMEELDMRVKDPDHDIDLQIHTWELLFHTKLALTPAT